MGFVKVVKNKAYFKRYQVKSKRHRQGKTDFYARQAMIHQDRNKYNTPKYRLIVRITNKVIVCHVKITYIYLTRRFPGFSREGNKFDAEIHRQRIFGLNVVDYMISLIEDNPELYGRQFSRFVKAGIEPSSFEALCKATHSAIRADPSALLKKEKKVNTPKMQQWSKPKLAKSSRKNRVQQRKTTFLKILQAS